MSAKQMVAHARGGDAFIFTTAQDRLYGWLVGMDDYHYLVLVHEALTDSLTKDDVWPTMALVSSEMSLALVHKSSPMILFMDLNISQTTDAVQDQVARVGDPFLSYWEQQPDDQPPVTLKSTRGGRS